MSKIEARAATAVAALVSLFTHTRETDFSVASSDVKGWQRRAGKFFVSGKADAGIVGKNTPSTEKSLLPRNGLIVENLFRRAMPTARLNNN